MSLSKNDAVALEEKRLHTLSKLFKSIVSYVLYFIAIITCLDMVGFSVTTIIAGAGVVSLAVAFGAQSIVQDLMSGIFIVLENQYAVGEYVQIDAISGQVKEIGMKTTKVQTADGHLMIISNGSIGKVINYSRAAQRGYVDVGIAYEEELEHAIAVMEQACQRIAAQYSADLEELPNVIGAIALADSAVTVRATFTAWNWQQLAIERALRKEIKEALNAAQVEISYPKVQLVQA
jgi:small conductance mechanosensitive channel